MHPYNADFGAHDIYMPHSHLSMGSWPPDAHHQHQMARAQQHHQWQNRQNAMWHAQDRENEMQSWQEFCEAIGTRNALKTEHEKSQAEHQVRLHQQKWLLTQQNARKSSGRPYVDYLSQVEEYMTKVPGPYDSSSVPMHSEAAGASSSFDPICYGFFSPNRAIYHNPPPFPKCLALDPAASGRNKLSTHTSSNGKPPDAPKKKRPSHNT